MTSREIKSRIFGFLWEYLSFFPAKYKTYWHGPTYATAFGIFFKTDYNDNVTYSNFQKMNFWIKNLHYIDDLMHWSYPVLH